MENEHGESQSVVAIDTSPTTAREEQGGYNIYSKTEASLVPKYIPVRTKSYVANAATKIVSEIHPRGWGWWGGGGRVTRRCHAPGAAQRYHSIL